MMGDDYYPENQSLAKPMDSWKGKCLDWAISNFGEVARNPRERAFRFVEEAVELGQAMGLTDDDMDAVFSRVMGRPKGEVWQEVAGVALTFDSLCAVIGVDEGKCARAVLDEISDKPREHWQAKHAEKVADGIAVECHANHVIPTAFVRSAT